MLHTPDIPDAVVSREHIQTRFNPATMVVQSLVREFNASRQGKEIYWIPLKPDIGMVSIAVKPFFAKKTIQNV